jgi:hypothetical protein
VGGGDDPRLGIDELDRRAVGRKRPADDAGPAGDDGVAPRPRGAEGVRGDQGVGGVDLVAGRQGLRRQAETGGGAGAVLFDCGRIVVRAAADV